MPENKGKKNKKKQPVRALDPNNNNNNNVINYIISSACVFVREREQAHALIWVKLIEGLFTWAGLTVSVCILCNLECLWRIPVSNGGQSPHSPSISHRHHLCCVLSKILRTKNEWEWQSTNRLVQSTSSAHIHFLTAHVYNSVQTL